MQPVRWGTVVVFGIIALASAPQVGAEPFYYWPAAPAYPPYTPPLNYGPGNHYPHPFQRWYPEHPTAHLYYPYTYLPYSAYYSYPTINTYGKSYNPYAPPPALRFPFAPMPVVPGVPAGEPLQMPRPTGAPAAEPVKPPVPAGQEQKPPEKKPEENK